MLLQAEPSLPGEWLFELELDGYRAIAGRVGGTVYLRSRKRVAFDGSRRTVTDGPFAHPRELTTRFWLWTVKDMDEAIRVGEALPEPYAGA